MCYPLSSFFNPSKLCRIRQDLIIDIDKQLYMSIINLTERMLQNKYVKEKLDFLAEYSRESHGNQQANVFFIIILQSGDDNYYYFVRGGDDSYYHTCTVLLLLYKDVILTCFVFSFHLHIMVRKIKT